MAVYLLGGPTYSVKEQIKGLPGCQRRWTGNRWWVKTLTPKGEDAVQALVAAAGLAVAVVDATLPSEPLPPVSYINGELVAEVKDGKVRVARVIKHKPHHSGLPNYGCYVRSRSSTLHRSHALSMAMGHGTNPLAALQRAKDELREMLKYHWTCRPRKFTDKDIRTALKMLDQLEQKLTIKDSVHA